MRTNRVKKIEARFEPETRFTVNLSPEGLHRRQVAEQLERLRQRLLARHLMYAPDLELTPAIRRAAQDAVSLAWMTPCPLLVFPLLLEEKVQEAIRQARKQQQVWHRSRQLMALAA